MGNHAGDPRSNILGEIPFDPLEYPYSPHQPPAPPPQMGNVNDYIPFRGGVNHGVANDRDPEEGYGAAGERAYSSDQAAQDRYTDPNISPRDLIPSKPIPVTIVDRPDLLRRLNSRTMNTRVKTNCRPVLIAPADPFRTRLLINVVQFENVISYLTTDPDAIETNAFPVSPYASQVDTATTSAVYGFTRPVGEPPVDEHGTQYGVWMETPQSNGDVLL